MKIKTPAKSLLLAPHLIKRPSQNYKCPQEVGSDHVGNHQTNNMKYLKRYFLYSHRLV